MENHNDQIVTATVTPSPEEGIASTSIPSDNLQDPTTETPQAIPTTSSAEPSDTQCNCKCHLTVPPLDESVHAESCHHCKPEAHQQPKQENYPNLNAGNNNEDNKWAEKWKTPEERIIACEKYCEYLRRGRSKRYYPEADENTIKRYMEKYPEEFRPEKIKDAERAGLAYIENIGFKGMTGAIKGFNATTWIWITKNKMNWRDKVEYVETDDFDLEFEKPDGD